MNDVMKKINTYNWSLLGNPFKINIHHVIPVKRKLQLVCKTLYNWIKAWIPKPLHVCICYWVLCFQMPVHVDTGRWRAWLPALPVSKAPTQGTWEQPSVLLVPHHKLLWLREALMLMNAHVRIYFAFCTDMILITFTNASECTCTNIFSILHRHCFWCIFKELSIINKCFKLPVVLFLLFCKQKINVDTF